MSDAEQSPYWECGGCGELFHDGEFDNQWRHALNEHGAVDAVSFTAVPSWEVEGENADT